MYSLAKREPEWLTLIPAQGTGRNKQPAVEVLFAPIDRRMKRLVARATRGLFPELDPQTKIADLSDEALDALLDATEASSVEMIRLGVLDWRGIGDGATPPKPLAPTPAREIRIATIDDPDRPTGTIDAFLADDDLLEAADRLYVKVQAARDAEKNGLSASSSGTGGAGTPAKAIAGSRPAQPKRTGAAQSAPTPKMRSAPRRPKAS